jgi:16S rRNA processing protein RimM
MTHVAGESTWLKKGQVIMLEMQKGSFIPYFVSQCKPANQGEYHLNLEEIDTQQEARKLVTRAVYVDEKLLAGLEMKSPLLWIGFTVKDSHYGDIGALLDVMQAGAQWIAKVDYKGSEALIPLVDATLQGIDIKARILKTTLPEGLLELYIQDEA